MEEYINKKVFLRIDVNGNILVFNATIKDVTSTHITFIDKFGDKYTYRISDVIELKEEEEDKGDDSGK